MQIVRALLACCVLGAAFSACSNFTPSITAPDRALFDGGSGFGSGHRVMSDGTDSTTAVSSTTEKTAGDSATTAERGGSMFGSGH
jgi:hypothetical protein